ALAAVVVAADGGRGWRGRGGLSHVAAVHVCAVADRGLLGENGGGGGAGRGARRGGGGGGVGEELAGGDVAGHLLVVVAQPGGEAEVGAGVAGAQVDLGRQRDKLAGRHGDVLADRVRQRGHVVHPGVVGVAGGGGPGDVPELHEVGVVDPG